MGACFIVTVLCLFCFASNLKYIKLREVKNSLQDSKYSFPYLFSNLCGYQEIFLNATDGQVKFLSLYVFLK